jgi:F-type H+-transporting ATPase subunit epsilon
MKLKVLVPTEVFVDEEAIKVTAEAENGSFCLLPQHIDFLAALVPGLLSFERASGEELFLAVDEGLLIKRDQQVLVATRQAVRGGDLGELRRTVQEQFETLDEHERTCHSAIAKLEADLLRHFLEFGELMK